MLFTSLQWGVFLLFTFAVFHAVPRPLRKAVMLGASIYFYASFSARHLFLIAAQLMVDFTCGMLLGQTEDPRRRRLIVTASVVFNLGCLCLFKYEDFFAANLNFLFPALHIPALHLTLPLAISFYTFESMSYTIDVYNRRIAPVRSPLSLALFITWFPHLIAGPIIRPSLMLPQLTANPVLTRERFLSGLMLMTVGYAKKLLGADWLATVADPIFAHPASCTAPDLLLGIYAYTFQLYLDFSAYTDIARGASRWFGIELPENFAAPYLATSITGYWRRWHKTLSEWLRDYLFFPLTYASLFGTRRQAWRRPFNVIVLMLLAGLWHGASWTFVVFGALHGVYMAVEQAVDVDPEYEGRGPRRWARQFLTYHLVCLAAIFFRSADLHRAVQYVLGLFRGPLHFSDGMALPLLRTGVILSTYWILAPYRERFLSLSPGPSRWQHAAYVGLFAAGILVFTVLGASSHVFIYFQF